MNYATMSHADLVSELRARDDREQREAEARAEQRFTSGDARLDDTGMTKADYADLYARDPELMDLLDAP